MAGDRLAEREIGRKKEIKAPTKGDHLEPNRSRLPFRERKITKNRKPPRSVHRTLPLKNE